ncbi:MAG: RIP metalloprotease RseP [Planctomycetota bacterium]
MKFTVDVHYIYGFDYTKFLSTRVCDVKNYSPAHNLGIQKGDRIISINNHKLHNWYELNKTLWQIRDSENLILEIEDKNSNKRTITTPNVSFVHGKPFLGITSCEDELNSNVFQVVPATFSITGIEPGDKLLEVNGKKVSALKELFSVTGEKYETLILKIQTPQNEIREIRKSLEKIPIITDSTIGAVPKIKTITVVYPFFEAVAKGFVQAIEFVRMTFVSIGLLMKKRVSTQDIAGPIGIIHIGAKVVQKSFIHFLYLLALISLNLAVLNLLPIPILDGSLIFMLIIEKIIGKRLPEKLVKVFEISGLCILLFILVFALKNDIMRLIK